MIEQHVANAGGLRAAWEQLARYEAEQRARVEERRTESERTMRELAA